MQHNGVSKHQRTSVQHRQITHMYIGYIQLESVLNISIQRPFFFTFFFFMNDAEWAYLWHIWWAITLADHFVWPPPLKIETIVEQKILLFRFFLFVFGLLCSSHFIHYVHRYRTEQRLSNHMLVTDMGRYSALYYSGGLVSVTEDEVWF